MNPIYSISYLASLTLYILVLLLYSVYHHLLFCIEKRTLYIRSIWKEQKFHLCSPPLFYKYITNWLCCFVEKLLLKESLTFLLFFQQPNMYYNFIYLLSNTKSCQRRENEFTDQWHINQSEQQSFNEILRLILTLDFRCFSGS